MRDDTNVDWIHGLPFHSFDPSAYGRSVALVAFTYSTPWLALALVTDRAFILDDPVLERLLDLDASDAFPIDVKEDPTKIRDDVLEMKLTSGSREEGGDDASRSRPHAPRALSFTTIA